MSKMLQKLDEVVEPQFILEITPKVQANFLRGLWIGILTKQFGPTTVEPGLILQQFLFPLVTGSVHVFGPERGPQRVPGGLTWVGP